MTRADNDDQTPAGAEGPFSQDPRRFRPARRNRQAAAAAIVGVAILIVVVAIAILARS